MSYMNFSLHSPLDIFFLSLHHRNEHRNNFPHGVRDARLSGGKVLTENVQRERTDCMKSANNRKILDTKLGKMIPAQIIAFKYI